MTPSPETPVSATPSGDVSSLRTDLFGEQQPEVIWLGTYKHSGEVRWEAGWPEEDSDEYQAVKYVRANTEDAIVLKRYREALEEIAKGEGAFSRDPLIHAENTIESMKAIARAALKAGA